MNFIDQVAALQEIGQAVERAVVDEDGAEQRLLRLENLTA